MDGDFRKIAFYDLGVAKRRATTFTGTVIFHFFSEIWQDLEFEMYYVHGMFCLDIPNKALLYVHM